MLKWKRTRWYAFILVLIISVLEAGAHLFKGRINFYLSEYSANTIIRRHINMGHSTENVELTVLCLLQDGNRILLQNRVKEDWKGYTFPGGHVEPGESFVDAVVREMKEETGLTICTPHLVGIKQFPIENGRYIVLLFKSTGFSGELVSSDEGEMEWIDIDKLAEVNVVEDFHDLMKVMNEPDINEFQYTIEGEDWIVHLK